MPLICRQTFAFAMLMPIFFRYFDVIFRYGFRRIVVGTTKMPRRAATLAGGWLVD